MNELLLSFIALLGILAACKKAGWIQKHLTRVIWITFALATFVAFAQYMASAHHHSYDTDLARAYDERFNR
ncbi:MAG: hypothetical protein KGJ37_05860, partial [Verrucomicrobiota bacterium]|nr:hypothetical protein [Verrucomicrobiota bacterium]